MNGNNDVGSVEFAVEMHRIIPGSQLAILPGTHGDYIGAAESLENGKWTKQYFVNLLEYFLNNTENTLLLLLIKNSCSTAFNIDT